MLELNLKVVGDIANLEIGIVPFPWQQSGESHRVVLERLEQLDRDPWHRGLLLCCGDLPASLAADASLRRLPTLLAAFRRPVVALVDGSVAGVGCSLALSADFLLGTLRTRLIPAGLPGSEEQQLAGLLHLPRQLGTQRTCELLRSGRPLDAVQAMSLGLLNELTTPKRSRARADQLVRQLAVDRCHDRQSRLDLLAEA